MDSAAPEVTLKLDRQLAKLKATNSELQGKYKHAINQLEVVTAALDAALSLANHTFSTAPQVIPTAKSEAIPILLWSDWHCGESVDPATVNGLNEYSPQIFRARVQSLFAQSARSIKMLRSTTEINTAVLWLGGDLITGYIHQELMESNALSPTEEILLAQEVITQGIKYLLDELKLEHLIIPCNFGNHGRTNEQPKVCTAHLNSYEWLLYHTLARSFEDDSRIQFYISDSHLLYLSAWDKVMRFTHGDAVKYSGGTNGLTVPVSKWIARQNAIIPADMTFLGHFHTLEMHSSFTTNGSLIGLAPYAMRLGFALEPPQQALVLLEKGKGFTVRAPLVAS